MKQVRRLPLDGAYNVRELGGYAIGKNAATAWQCFLRSDGISELTKADIKYLKEYGVKAVLDLRSNAEVQMQPDKMKDDEDIEYIHISFMLEEIKDVTKVDPTKASSSFTLGDFYTQLLKNKNQVKAIMESIASVKDGIVLFHCSAGKDRTGVVAMLLLGLMGVERQDIITNYEQTFTNLNHDDKFKEELKAKQEYAKFMGSNPKEIEKAILYIEDNYDSYEDYLLSCDISKEVLNLIKNKFISV